MTTAEELMSRLTVGDTLLLKGSTIKTKRGLVTSPDRAVTVSEITRTHIKFTDGGGWKLTNPEPWPFVLQPLYAAPTPLDGKGS